MCGIYGYQLAPKQHLTTYQAVSLSMILAQHMEGRGRESFGAMYTLPDTEPQVLHRLGAITSNGGTLFERTIPARQLCVHTRQSTHGKVSKANAHPFTIGDIIGVHNGIIYNHDDLNRTYSRGYEVDSQHIFGHLDAGLELNELEGYGAVVYMRRSKPDTLALFRFNSGTLYAARIFKSEAAAKKEQSLGVVYASTRMAVIDALSIAGLYGEFVKLSEGRVYHLSDGEVWKTDRRLHIPFGYVSYYTGTTRRGSGYGSTASASRKAGEFWDYAVYNTSDAAADGQWKFIARTFDGLTEAQAYVERTKRGLDCWGSTSTVKGKKVYCMYRDYLLGALAEADSRLAKRTSGTWNAVTDAPFHITDVHGVPLGSTMSESAWHARKLLKMDLPSPESKKSSDKEQSHECADCQCALLDHTYGACLRCAVLECSHAVETACDDCGCDLQNSHTEYGMASKTTLYWCETCNVYCEPADDEEDTHYDNQHVEEVV